MAGSLTKTSASPSSLKYRYSGGDIESASKTAAQIIADCAEGPLKAFLKQINAGLNGGVVGQTWQSLGEFAPLSIYISLQTYSGGSTQTGAIMANFNSGANRFDALSFVSGGTVQGVIEIRLHPTAVR